MLNEKDFICPKCGCKDATKVPIELLDGAKTLWYYLLIASVFGVALSPFFVFISIILIVVVVILNILKKIAYRNEWVMQCTRCGTEYSVPNPDREDAINKAIEKKQLKQEERALYIKEKNEKIAKCLELNGKLNEDEQLLTEIKNIGLHTSVFITKYGNIKITNQSILYYNSGGSLRISKNNLLGIRKKNYFLVIPTGIEIKTSKRTIKLVVESSRRDEIIALMNK